MLEKAGFTAYLKSSLSVKEDGSFDFDSATPVVIGANGETQLFTDEMGHLVTIPIPYGTYVVIETVTPHNMETIKPFEVHITENNPTEPQVWRVFIDREFTAKLRVIKKDADTGMTVLIPNTEFKIFNTVTFLSDLPLGKYYVKEMEAPAGYVKSGYKMSRINVQKI